MPAGARGQGAGSDREQLVISDADLYQRAKAALNPRRLSPHVAAGKVASALVSAQGNVHVGVCIETDCQMGFCAEHNAIGSMVTAGENRIVTIVAVDQDGRIIAPCGRCREFIHQMHADNGDTRLLLSRNRVAAIRDLLPEHWASNA